MNRALQPIKSKPAQIQASSNPSQLSMRSVGKVRSSDSSDSSDHAVATAAMASSDSCHSCDGRDSRRAGFLLQGARGRALGRCQVAAGKANAALRWPIELRTLEVYGLVDWLVHVGRGRPCFKEVELRR